MAPNMHTPSYITICTILSIFSIPFTFIVFILISRLYCNCKKCNKSVNIKPSTPSTASSTETNDQYVDDDADLNKWFKCSSMSGMACYYLSLLSNLFMVLFILIYNKDNPLTSSMAIIMPTFYFIADWMRLLIFCLRTDLSFRDSYLAYSKCTINTLYIAVFFMLFLVVVMIFLIGLGQFDAVRPVAGLYGFLDFVLSITFTILFMKKLFLLIMKRIEFKTAEMMARTPSRTPTTDNQLPTIQLSASSDTAQSSDIDVGANPQTPNNEQQRNEQQMNEHAYTAKKDVIIKAGMKSMVPVDAVRIVTKYALLVVIAVFSTFASLVLAALPVLDKWDKSGVPIHQYSYLGFDSFINGICIYLFFKFGDDIYDNICKCGHNCCTKCCVCCIICRLKNGLSGLGGSKFDQYEGLILHD